MDEDIRNATSAIPETSLDVFQQVFRLSAISNGLFKSKGDLATLQGELEEYVADEIPNTGKDWELAWGPTVWKKDPGNADTGPVNSWYIAFNPRLQFEDGSVHPTYVIAIAGTPLYSDYAWFYQNFPVNTVSDFKAWVAGGLEFAPTVVPPQNVKKGNAYIATGTVNGVHLLVTEPAPESAVAGGTSLLDFISDVDRSRAPKFIFTGTSLGAALASSLALALVHARTIPDKSTLTYLSAGPSPGNIYFTKLFVDTFPSSRPDGSEGYKGWNLNLVNTLDIVPQAWASYKEVSEKQRLQNIPTMYGEPPVPEVAALINVAIAWSRLSLVYYKPLPSQYFTGTQHGPTPKNKDEFLVEFGLQHIHSYPAEVGVHVEPIDE